MHRLTLAPNTNNSRASCFAATFFFTTLSTVYFRSVFGSTTPTFSILKTESKTVLDLFPSKICSTDFIVHPRHKYDSPLRAPLSSTPSPHLKHSYLIFTWCQVTTVLVFFNGICWENSFLFFWVGRGRSRQAIYKRTPASTPAYPLPARCRFRRQALRVPVDVGPPAAAPSWVWRIGCGSGANRLQVECRCCTDGQEKSIESQYSSAADWLGNSRPRPPCWTNHCPVSLSWTHS